MPLNCSPAAARRTGHVDIAGFTLIELLVVVVIVGVLSLIAMPSFQAAVLKSRRADALVAMMQIQLTQSRWRANSDRYGSLAEIGVPAVSSGGNYSLTLSSESPDSYAVVATATGAQTRDAACRFLKVGVAGAEVSRASGSDATTANDVDANRICWGQ